MSDQQTNSRTDRRGFISTSAALAAGGLVFGDWSEAQAADMPRRKLGRTGMSVSVLSFGAIQLNSPSHQAVLERAIDQGVNFVHVSPGYQGGKAMEVVGAVMKRKRNQVFLALKQDPGNIDGSLQKLNTDHVDLLIPDTKDVDNNAKRDAFKKLKDSGKARWCGFACHSGMADRLTRAYKAGWMDVNLIAYNYGNKGELDPVIARAVQAQKMGFMVMKSSQGLNSQQKANYPGVIKGLLAANSNLATITAGMATVQHVDANIKGVLTLANWQAKGYLEELSACAGKVCSFCGSCTQACPRGVAVDDYLRAYHYRERGDIELARELVDSIPQLRSMARCDNCGICNGTCHKNLDVVGMLRSIERV